MNRSDDGDSTSPKVGRPLKWDEDAHIRLLVEHEKFRAEFEAEHGRPPLSEFEVAMCMIARSLANAGIPESEAKRVKAAAKAKTYVNRLSIAKGIIGSGW